MKVLAAIALLLVLSPHADATPKWVKRTAEYAVYAAPVIMSVLATKGGVDCRHRNGVEPCTAHYGSFWGTEGARLGVAVTFSGLSMYGHRAGFKEWFAPAIGLATFDGYWWRREEGIHASHEESSLPVRIVMLPGAASLNRFAAGNLNRGAH